MIERWEIHLKTRNTIGGILSTLKTKGISADFKLMNDKDYHSKLMIKNPANGEIYHFGFKLYCEAEGIYTYEICAWTEQEYNYLIELAKSI
jgi:hypothetical protein